MKIIKDGSQEKLREYELAHQERWALECERCGCKFEVANGEEGIVYSYQYDEMSIRCPYCKNWIDIID